MIKFKKVTIVALVGVMAIVGSIARSENAFAWKSRYWGTKNGHFGICDTGGHGYRGVACFNGTSIAAVAAALRIRYKLSVTPSTVAKAAYNWGIWTSVAGSGKSAYLSGSMPRNFIWDIMAEYGYDVVGMSGNSDSVWKKIASGLKSGYVIIMRAQGNKPFEGDGDRYLVIYAAKSNGTVQVSSPTHCGNDSTYCGKAISWKTLRDAAKRNVYFYTFRKS